MDTKTAEKKKIILTVFVILLLLPVVFLSGCTNVKTVSQDYQFSYVCDNLGDFQGKSELVNYAVENGANITYVMPFNFVNGIVFFSAFNEGMGNGIIIISAREQIMRHEVAKKYIAVRSEYAPWVKQFNVGSIVTLKNAGIKWKTFKHQGETIWIIEEPGTNLIKTGEIPAGDPLYDSDKLQK